MAGCHHRGPTARSGWSGWLTPPRVSSRRATRRTGVSGRPTRASSTARCWHGSAMATTRSARGRASFANGCWRASSSPPRDLLDIQLDTERRIPDPVARPAAADAHPGRDRIGRQASTLSRDRRTRLDGKASAAPPGIASPACSASRSRRRSSRSCSSSATKRTAPSTTGRSAGARGRSGRLVSQKPQHLLDPRFKSWDAVARRPRYDAAIERANRMVASTAPWSQVQRHALPASAVGGSALRWPLARHATAAGRRRPLHADALGFERRVGANDRVAGARGEGHHAHADRPERAPAVAVLRELARGVGQGESRRRFCRGDRTHADADAVTRFLLFLECLHGPWSLVLGAWSVRWSKVLGPQRRVSRSRPG